MIRRIDRIAVELPPPSEPDPAGAQAVQELMGGRFGEVSDFMNYTIQSFNFRADRSEPHNATIRFVDYAATSARLV